MGAVWGEQLFSAFPKSLSADVEAVVRIIPPGELESATRFEVRVGSELVSVPYRMYTAEPAATEVRELTDRQRLVLHCVYSRHHDGRVRQRHLRAVMSVVRDWTLPYMVRVLGEYVIEIALDVVEAATRSAELREALREFGARNAEFVVLTGQQAASYWNAYHRHRFPRLSDYPPSALLDGLRADQQPETVNYSAPGDE